MKHKMRHMLGRTCRNAIVFLDKNRNESFWFSHSPNLHLFLPDNSWGGMERSLDFWWLGGDDILVLSCLPQYFSKIIKHYIIYGHYCLFAIVYATDSMCPLSFLCWNPAFSVILLGSEVKTLRIRIRWVHESGVLMNEMSALIRVIEKPASSLCSLSWKSQFAMQKRAFTRIWPDWHSEPPKL